MQVTISCACASRVSVLHDHRKRPPVQVAVGPGPYKQTMQHAENTTVVVKVAAHEASSPYRR